MAVIPGSGAPISLSDASRFLFLRLPFDRRQHFRVAHVHPAPLDLQTGQLMIRGQQAIDRFGQFILAARGFLQPGGELIH